MEEAPKAEDKGTDAAEIERRREQRRPGRRTPKPKPKSRKQRGPQSPQTGQHSPQASSPRLPAAPAPAGSDQKPNKKFMKILAIVIAIAAVFSIGALAYKKMTAKDPKEVVIAAFENAFPEDQVSPLEELFGLTEFADTSATTDREGRTDLKA